MKSPRDGRPTTSPSLDQDDRAGISAPQQVATRSSFGWRSAALAVAVAIVGLVAIARFGGASDQPLTSSQPSFAVALATVTPQPPQPSATPRPRSIGGLIGRPAVGAPIRRTADGLDYIDGIPTAVAGVPVDRVRDALLLPVGSTVLVGGWYVPGPCTTTAIQRQCSSAVLADVPIDQQGTGWLATDWLVVQGTVRGSGGLVLRGTLDPDPNCSINLARPCQPLLRVVATSWTSPGT